MSASNVPTETSPLIPKTGDDQGLHKISSRVIDAGAGIAPDGADVIGAYESDESGEIANGDAEDGDDIERQVSNDGRLRQYQGLPEVKKQMFYILPAVAIGVFLAAIDQTIIVSTYGLIGTELKSLSNTSWIATAYFLTLTSCQPLYGKLSDIFGRKSCLLFSYTIFGLGCLFCGLAKDMNQLIAARAFAGIGGGGMTTVVSILVSDVVTLRERGKWQGYLNIVYASGSALGAPLGGIMADTIGWRWGFMAQAPLCLIAFIAVALVLDLPKRDDSHWREKLGRIDFFGAFVLVGAVFTLLLGMDRGSNVSWADNITLISIGISIPLFLLFVFVEMRIASEPFAPGHIIFERSLFACYVCNFFSFAGWLAAIFYIPLYFQVYYGLSATQAGVRLIPSIIASVSGSLFSGIYMQRTGKYYLITLLAYHGLAVGLLLIILFSGGVSHSVVGMLIGMIISGFSNGIGVTTSLISLIANADHADQAIATACSYLFRSLGGVFGVSLSAACANQALRDALTRALKGEKDAEQIAERVRKSLDYIKQLSPAAMAIVRGCYEKSTRVAFSVQISLAVCAALGSWFIREKKLSG